MPEDPIPAPSTDGQPSDEEIARLAYRYYEEEGYPEGRADEHWHRAQQKIRGPVPPWTVESGAGDA